MIWCDSGSSDCKTRAVCKGLRKWQSADSRPSSRVLWTREIPPGLFPTFARGIAMLAAVLTRCTEWSSFGKASNLRCDRKDPTFNDSGVGEDNWSYFLVYCYVPGGAFFRPPGIPSPQQLAHEDRYNLPASPVDVSGFLPFRPRSCFACLK